MNRDEMMNMTMMILFVFAFIFIIATVGIIVAVIAANNSKSKQIRPEGQYCSGCGAPLSTTNKFCDKCGKEI